MEFRFFLLYSFWERMISKDVAKILYWNLLYNNPALAKVSDWNSFRVNQNYSASFRYLCDINVSPDWFGLIWIENLVSYWFGFIRIDVSELIGLNRIDFWPFFIKRDTKHFSDWFEIIRIGSDIDIGMNRNSYD